MKGYIYCHTNKVNGKRYIGQTTQDPQKRWGKEGSNYSKQICFYRDIISMGWDNFDHIILETVEAKSKKELKEALDNLEVKYIKQHKTMQRDHGYNTVYKDKNLYARLTVPAKRCINKYMQAGDAFDEAYKKYKQYKR